MRTVIFSKTSEIGPSSRYRYAQYREVLKDRGIKMDFRPLFGRTYFTILRIRPCWLRALFKCIYVPIRFVARLTQIMTIGHADLVVVEHQLFPYLPVLFERWLTRSGRRWILEFDDAIFLTSRHRRKMEMLCGLATHVVVGNRFLADFAEKHASAVSVVPTTIDLTLYPPSTEIQKDYKRGAITDPVVVGWIGLPYNFDALKLVAPSLRQLQEKEGQVVFRVISAGQPDLRGIRMDCREWSLGREASDIADLDIGIMPLPDTNWSRGKCGLKILQYFACSIPVIASPIGVNSDIIQHGANGFLASDDGEWLEHLKMLVSDPDLRRHLGVEGRKTVEESYSHQAWAPRIESIWRNTAGRPS